MLFRWFLLLFRLFSLLLFRWFLLSFSERGEACTHGVNIQPPPNPATHKKRKRKKEKRRRRRRIGLKALIRFAPRVKLQKPEHDPEAVVFHVVVKKSDRALEERDYGAARLSVKGARILWL